jgi:hypothetical protein
MENDKENTDEEKEHKHGWQHVKKRKRIHQSAEISIQINSEIGTQNRYTLLLTDKRTKKAHKPVPTETCQIS